MAPARVEVLEGGLHRMTSILIESARRCLLVDAGYFPREIAELGALAREHGSLKALVFTHSHWDRICGHLHFPDLPVWASETLVEDLEKNGAWSKRNLEQLRAFEARWYIQRPDPLLWPASLYGISDDERRKLGDATLRFLLLPGHSPDSMGLILEDSGLLVAGEYLSPCEIPVFDDFDTYYRTLHRLSDLLDGGVQEVIPGRGWRMSREEAKHVAREDLSYLYQIMFFRDSGDMEAARNMMLPRLNDEPEIRALHIANCEKLEEGQVNV